MTFNIFANGKYNDKGQVLPRKNYPNGYKTTGLLIIDDVSSDERNNKGCVLGQKITYIGKRCNSNINIENIVYATFLQNGQALLTNMLGAQLSGHWEKTENVITVYLKGFVESQGKISKLKKEYTIDENNNYTMAEYIWKCNNWVKTGEFTTTFIESLDC